ncbi:MAG: hypothetical protein ONB53_21955, partial [candidate division KSB1 bacterium]|nr:hypothetical protein [candidate division KSB1 bacterium]MDZ7300433.1 hypothetical protein [candidate division KSB1 bacterium]MDZ7308712.1 hypothetical protein [candidate division KSB1 bacterium]MDZ7355824.1 hypothetical protein [candidate division KSB1 bacterium]MDZ7384454.1 hypothetical protein [candidate division KSB1 bacterium]
MSRSVPELRHHLVALLGRTPQVLTETLYALCVQQGVPIGIPSVNRIFPLGESLRIFAQNSPGGVPCGLADGGCVPRRVLPS